MSSTIEAANTTAGQPDGASSSSDDIDNNDNQQQQKRSADDDGGDATVSPSHHKRQKNENDEDTPPLPAPVYLFATTTDVQARRHSGRDHWSRKECLTLREMLGIGDYNNDSATTGPIEWLFVANYIINFEFLLDEVPELLSLPRACVVYGSKEGSEEAWRQACTTLDGDCSVEFICRNPSDPPNSATNPLPTRIPYGVHHSKIFLIGYGSGSLRVIIHTANLRYSDIHHKCQAAYIQDFPRKQPQQLADTAITCEFEQDLVSYMESIHYNTQHKYDPSAPTPTTLAQHLKLYDFSSATAVLIPSTPGSHKIENCRLGHLKLRTQVHRLRHRNNNEARQASGNPEGSTPTTSSSCTSGPIICQFSSIGSLTTKYLHRLQTSFDVHGDANSEDDETKPLKLQFVYPTSDEICNSLEGYRGGASVPGALRNVSKDFLKPLFRKWSASKSFLASLSLSPEDDHNAPSNNPLWKGNNVPHIKTYFQLTSSSDNDIHNDDIDAMEWFMVTSHNLSKAAWGDVQNSSAHGEKRLFIRHWELGVFICPRLLKAKRLVPWTPERAKSPGKGEVTIPLPYRHKSLPYADSDKPWAVDQRYVRLDIFGRRSVDDP